MGRLEGSLLHGAVGGASSVAQGGRFGPGFLAAGVSEFAGPEIRDVFGDNFAGKLVGHATLGGIAAEFGGGKFGNGFATAAFGYLFNSAAHDLAVAGAAVGALVGAAAVAGGCDYVTVGACVIATPITVPAGAAAGGAIGGLLGWVFGGIVDTIDDLFSGTFYADRAPPGSKPIDQTPWSGDHQQIKSGVGAGPADNVKIAPNGDVWVENPDGSWDN